MKAPSVSPRGAGWLFETWAVSPRGACWLFGSRVTSEVTRWILNGILQVSKSIEISIWKKRKGRIVFLLYVLKCQLLSLVLLCLDTFNHNSSDFIPVCEDQKQHLEMTRELAERVN